MSLLLCRRRLPGRGTRCGLGCTWARRGRDHIVTEQVDRGLLTLRGGLTGCGNSLRRGTFNLGLLLDDRKRLVGQRWLFESYMVCFITHHVIISIIQGRGVGHSSVHHPALGLVFGSNEVLDFSAMSPSALNPPGYHINAITYASDGTWPGASLASQYLYSMSTNPIKSIASH